MHGVPALCFAKYLSLYCFFFLPNQVQLACCSCFVFSMAIHATRLPETHKHCHSSKILSFCYNHSASVCVFPSHHSCSSGEGMRPAVPFFVFSSLPCHQLWSSLEMIWMMSPTRKRMPASLQGISSSLEGSYSN